MSTESKTLREGDKILHAFNRELGPGVIESITGNRMSVHFPRTGDTLLFATANHPFVPLAMQPGANEDDWTDSFQDDMVERLARCDVERPDAFWNRWDALSLMKLREETGFGSFLGGRIQLFPHQLHVADVATRRLPVRWLLADEVGLGKTVEACLILNHLVRTGQAERVLIVAPRALVVQWLGELYRKFHQVFVLIDDDRRQDVRKENGPGFNPFDVYDQAVVALEDLVEDSSLAKLASAGDFDLVIVDEAHRLRRRKGTPGSPEYRAVAPLCSAAPHTLLLSATPLEADAHGFFRLLEILHPDEFSSWDDFQAALEGSEPIYPCTSCTTRKDIGGLPPRVGRPVELLPNAKREAKELEVLSLPAEDALQAKRRLEKFAEVLSRPLDADDPRIGWLGKEARQWIKDEDKTLIFVHDREGLTFLKKELEYHTSRRVAVFHEDLSPAQRDLEVARFAEEDGPPFLIATESGGEGRNFQFAKRIVMFDLPWDPLLVEQRIGRLDRINREDPVEIVYFRPAEGFGREVAALYEALGIFREPLSGLERALTHVVDAVQEALDGSGGNLDIETVVSETERARARVAGAVYHDLHQNRFEPEMAQEILARVPKDLESRTRHVVLEACRQFGFEMEPKGGTARWYLEFGAEATVETLYGVPPGARYFGTFDREEAVSKEGLDFFASGHDLVEGVLGELGDGTRGQVTLLEVRGAPQREAGLLLLFKEGANFSVETRDLAGKSRPDWLALLEDRRTIVGISGEAWDEPGWINRVRQIVPDVEALGDLVGVAGVRFRI